jgi:hypothetical protein
MYITTAVTSSDLADKMGFDCKQAEIVMSPHGKNVNMELLLLLLLLIIIIIINNNVALIVDTEQLHNYIPLENGLFQVYNCNYSA